MRIIAAELRTVNVCESSWKTLLSIGHMAGKSELDSISYEATFSLQRAFRLFFGILWRIGGIFFCIKVIYNNFLGQKQVISELRIFRWFLGILQVVFSKLLHRVSSFSIHIYYSSLRWLVRNCDVRFSNSTKQGRKRR